MAHSELGWALSGYSRAVRDVALRRAKVSDMGRDDIYAQIFNASSWASLSWNQKSSVLVHDWKLAPSTYLEPANPVSNKYDKYKAEVTAKLTHWIAARQQESIRKTSAALPYYVVQTEFSSSVLKQCVAQDLEWDIAVGVRSWCSLCASFVDLVCNSVSHGCRECIFCKAGCRNPNKHVLGVCQAWKEQRQAFLDAYGARLASSDAIVTAILTDGPQSGSFASAVRLCHGIDVAATLFWTAVK